MWKLLLEFVLLALGFFMLVKGADWFVDGSSGIADRLGVPQLVEKLQERGIEAERKSVYGDLNTLNSLPGAPYEIVQLRGRGGGKSGIHPAPGEPDGHHHPDGGPHAGP